MKSQTAQSIISSLGNPRFTTYLAAGGNNRSKALDLYLWNTEAAAAVISTTGMVEVQLRNTLNVALCTWNQAQPLHDPNRTRPYTTEWLKDPAPRLAQIISVPGKPPMWKSALRSMKDASGNTTKQNPTHNDLVAGLTFGSWTSLLPRPNATSNTNPRLEIWQQGLKDHFQAGATNHDSEYDNRNAIYYWANQIRYARNRASHLEPLLNVQQLMLFHRVSIRLMHSMNPDAASWLAGQAYLPKVINKKP